ncbi:hypothetical protein NC651_038729 [Populus alba x Populus x berolinensis]|nr:hypothetical protein NC651_038729 [Populus alba x Populus x berolinensis]
MEFTQRSCLLAQKEQLISILTLFCPTSGSFLYLFQHS